MYLITGTIEAEEKLSVARKEGYDPLTIFQHEYCKQAGFICRQLGSYFYSESIIADFNNSSAMAKSASNQSLLSN